MKRIIYISCLLSVFTLFSCKNESTTPTDTKTAAKTEVTYKLANYTDSNWTGGVGNDFNMFIVDNNPTNAAALKSAKTVELVDGTSLKITGINVADPFIQINIAEKASDYKAKAAYPNDIFLK